MEKFGESAPAIDVHNRHRQDILGLEKIWRVYNQDWWHRGLATFVGMTETDSYFSFEFFEKGQRVRGNDTQPHLAFTETLAMQLIHNNIDGLSPATSPAGTRHGGSASGDGCAGSATGGTPQTPMRSGGTSSRKGVASPGTSVHTLFNLADLDGAPRAYVQSMCSVCKYNHVGVEKRSAKYCPTCSQLEHQKVCVICPACVVNHSRHPEQVYLSTIRWYVHPRPRR